MQDFISVIAVIGVLWLVIKLAFGGPSSSSTQGAGLHGARGTGASGSVSKESAAAQAWRESRDDRQRQLKQRKLDMIEAARKRLLEQEQLAKQTNTASNSSFNQPSSSSSIYT